ncbi:sulfate ABC transporter ATP-binding protein [Anaerocolumna cellulosilytica]|uniref:Sulfate ABC transporter ATP-binding protein n=1 Tax=Anaerocolumna cellulosilytica TaxID=433286 RepID=A0A6S6QTU9_9FIRM|nr:ABC transporter ATP-binding protein/permease [Anaerocolumna cellulosilytica]MBB5197247.1 putative ABC transport system permease protein [Anaerocolumna cellulosilytica]BCJ94054.1 sulfate ABC transporter ATP-binding protein [Anaerocolumna cellulosilytica]
MLQLKDIKKSYTTGDFTQIALNGVNLNFRKHEFVAILGPSGSGKTTCLNVVGGLDKYDSGDLIINSKSTKNFKDGEWDAYRNNSVGFIFQSYNLIPHLSIVDNVEMGMTLSGVSMEEKHRKALEALDKVGLKEHVHKKPNQLSGGQMQRVAIARALANNPDIILADEPTGALDSVTSGQIMDLIKKIADDKLVIMVTHNPELAEKYADRIVKFKDGNVVDDSYPYRTVEEESEYQLKRTSMSFFTALKLSGKNISTKKGRTALTAFAASIGIIGIALILSLSTGFQIQIDKFQKDALAEFPIIISPTSQNMDMETLEKMRGEMKEAKEQEYTNAREVYLYDPEESTVTHTNNITKEYLDYIEKIDSSICTSIGYTRVVGMNLLSKIEDEIIPVSIAPATRDGSNGGGMQGLTSMSGTLLSSYPEVLDESQESYLEKNYDLLSGNYPKEDTDLVLVVNSSNQVDYTVFENLGIKTHVLEKMKFEDIVGMELKLVTNNDYYQETELGNFMPQTDYEEMYKSDDNLTLKIAGIIRLKEDVTIGILGTGIAYSDNLVQRIIEIEEESDIVLAQKEADYNVMTMEKLEESMKKNLLSYLGGDTIPYMIFLYPYDFETKDEVLAYLDAYNNGKSDEDTIVYQDLASTMTSMTGSIMNGITIVLIAFASISLVVSLIMVGIITYISVLERTKEIGVLRALGARKKDITRVFNAETFLIGAFSGLLGIGIAYLLTIPTNIILNNMTGLSGVAKLNPMHALVLVAISVVLTLIGGMIPAKMAAKKDPVEALRSE